jgi:hypothetical protein
VDETKDISNKEQMVVCFHWVDSDHLEACESFVGLYEITSTKTDVL